MKWLDLTYFTYETGHYSKSSRGLRKSALEKEKFRSKWPKLRYPKSIKRNLFIWKLIIIIKVLKNDLKFARTELRLKLFEIRTLRDKIELLEKQCGIERDCSREENV